MTKLIILRGVPGSGKSTHAAVLQKQGATVVNRDGIRFTLFGEYWGKGVDENVVTDAENAAINASLEAGHDTVVDATNLRASNLRTKLSLASRWGAEVEYVDFPISYGEAVMRDAARERTVGDKVIRNFFKKYRIDETHGVLPRPPQPLPLFEPYDVDASLPPAYIVDTDGTTADHEGVRGIFDHSKYHLDLVREHVAQIVRGVRTLGVNIIGVSGRDDTYRAVTEQWYRDNNIPFDLFYMRAGGDKRMDAIVKYEIFKQHIEPNFNVLAALDDRPQIIRMWRTIGVPVIDVGFGKEF